MTIIAYNRAVVDYVRSLNYYIKKNIIPRTIIITSSAIILTSTTATITTAIITIDL